MGTLIAYPWLALVACGFFVLLWRTTRSKTTALVALLWACYSAYEFLIHARILCTGECNIRIDLLLIYPLLVVFSISAVVGSFRVHRHTRHAA